MNKISLMFLILSMPIFLAGCNSIGFEPISKTTKSFFSQSEKQSDKVSEVRTVRIETLLRDAPASVNMGQDFEVAVRSAVEGDPMVLSARSDYEKSLAKLGVTRSLQEFQFSGSFYGGVEDVTDETTGLAAVLNANKLLYDGGKLDSQISADQFLAEAAGAEYEMRLDESALNALSAWIELERYQTLQQLIDDRLEILNPLISQLEKVASAGLGDASMVAAAQRTVSLIRVTQTDVTQRLAQASVNFVNIYGDLPGSLKFDGKLISDNVPNEITEALILKSPAIRANYASYKSAVAGLSSIKATDSFNIGFETKVQRPFGGSGFDSDESVGLVLRKNFYDGNRLDSEIAYGEAQIKTQLELFRSTYRLGERSIKTAQQTILAMDKAIDLAKSNAINARDEISYLRKQLVIGQSTLDSVLSAEARLYDAESKEINFLADRYFAEMTILASTGRLRELFDLR